MLYPAELRAHSLTLPNSALKRPVFEAVVALAPQNVNFEQTALHALGCRFEGPPPIRFGWTAFL
jgi:hypothetical protein